MTDTLINSATIDVARILPGAIKASSIEGVVLKAPQIIACGPARNGPTARAYHPCWSSHCRGLRRRTVVTYLSPFYDHSYLCLSCLHYDSFDGSIPAERDHAEQRWMSAAPLSEFEATIEPLVHKAWSAMGHH